MTDYLYGGAGLDWYFAGMADIIYNTTSAEAVTPVKNTQGSAAALLTQQSGAIFVAGHTFLATVSFGGPRGIRPWQFCLTAAPSLEARPEWKNAPVNFLNAIEIA
jgi:hypothetical protein